MIGSTIAHCRVVGRLGEGGDIFAFGAVLYEMIAGATPCKKGSAAETISAILGEAPPPPRIEDTTIGAEVGRILRRCRTKDPAARYQGIRDLVVDLRALRESLGGSDSRPRVTPATAVVHPAPPPGPPYARVAAVIVVAVVGTGAWLAMGSRATPPASPAAAVPRGPHGHSPSRRRAPMGRRRRLQP